MNRKTLRLSLIILLLAICWQLFLSSGIDFFWEDFDAFHPYWQRSAEFKAFKERYLPESINPSRLTLTLGIGNEFIKQFFAPRRLFQIGFGAWSYADRPYQFLTWDLLKVYFNNKAILYRMFRVIVFAIITCIVFLLINRISTLLAIFGVLLYMSSSEIWLSTLYISNLALFAQCGVIISILLFIKLMERSPLRHKDAWLYYFLIMLVSNYSVLTKGDGRYLAAIFFLTILFFRRRELKFHIAPLTILLMMELPLLGYMKKLFVSNSFSPINLASHEITSSNLSSLFMAISNCKFPMNALGTKLLIILLIVISIHLIYIVLNYFLAFFHKNISIQNETQQLKERIFLFLLWFICTLAMSARVRSFRYGRDPFYFELYDLSYFIAPFITFICYYILLLKSYIKKPFSIVFFSVILCLMSMQIISNIIRLDEFRNRSGYHFCVWQNARKYIDNNSNKALALVFAQTHLKPFVFIDSNNKVLNTKDSCEQSQFCDLSFIESRFKEEGYKDIFVLGRNELKFRGDSNNLVFYPGEYIDGNCSDLYGCLKLAFGKGSKYKINLYHFKFNN